MENVDGEGVESCEFGVLFLLRRSAFNSLCLFTCRTIRAVLFRAFLFILSVDVYLIWL